MYWHNRYLNTYCRVGVDFRIQVYKLGVKSNVISFSHISCLTWIQCQSKVITGNTYHNGGTREAKRFFNNTFWKQTNKEKVFNLDTTLTFNKKKILLLILLVIQICPKHYHTIKNVIVPCHVEKYKQIRNYWCCWPEYLHGWSLAMYQRLVASTF